LTSSAAPWSPAIRWWSRSLIGWRAPAVTCTTSFMTLPNAERECGFVSLGEAWCDTTTDVGRLMLTIMGGISEFERGLIRKRCEEGIERAKRRGTKFGRPATLDPSQRQRIAERYSAGETMAELAREYECGEATIWRALQ